MLEGMYIYYAVIGIGLSIIGVVYGIRLQMRQNFGKKLASLTGDKLAYSEMVSVLGEPKYIGSCAGENGERLKTATWTAPGVTVTISFDKDDYSVEVVNSLVSEP